MPMIVKTAGGGRAYVQPIPTSPRHNLDGKRAAAMLDAGVAQRIGEWFQKYAVVLVASFVTAVVSTLVTHHLAVRDYRKFEAQAIIDKRDTDRRLASIERSLARNEALLETLIEMQGRR